MLCWVAQTCTGSFGGSWSGTNNGDEMACCPSGDDYICWIQGGIHVKMVKIDANENQVEQGYKTITASSCSDVTTGWESKAGVCATCYTISSVSCTSKLSNTHVKLNFFTTPRLFLHTFIFLHFVYFSNTDPLVILLRCSRSCFSNISLLSLK